MLGAEMSRGQTAASRELRNAKITWIQRLTKPSLFQFLTEAGIEAAETESIDELRMKFQALVRRDANKDVGAGAAAVLENPLTSVIARHDSHMRKSGVTQPGIKPSLPWREKDDQRACSTILDMRLPRSLPGWLSWFLEQYWRLDFYKSWRLEALSLQSCRRPLKMPAGRYGETLVEETKTQLQSGSQDNKHVACAADHQREPRVRRKRCRTSFRSNMSMSEHNALLALAVSNLHVFPASRQSQDGLLQAGVDWSRLRETYLTYCERPVRRMDRCFQIWRKIDHQLRMSTILAASTSGGGGPSRHRERSDLV
ncbi:hypothetical protein PR048_013516 [Dryococelus australis]|uniref:Uncharacterized protein n=1 Tax=Dryococelus australis TaxID=614101 RepID=A0ABQ9HT87_9NEOP|nr:hypothetical protein PR048_013516 [Dryococelus australis]